MRSDILELIPNQNDHLAKFKVYLVEHCLPGNELTAESFYKETVKMLKKFDKGQPFLYGSNLYFLHVSQNFFRQIAQTESIRDINNYRPMLRNFLDAFGIKYILDVSVCNACMYDAAAFLVHRIRVEVAKMLTLVMKKAAAKYEDKHSEEWDDLRTQVLELAADFRISKCDWVFKKGRELARKINREGDSYIIRLGILTSEYIEFLIKKGYLPPMNDAKFFLEYTEQPNSVFDDFFSAL